MPLTTWFHRRSEDAIGAASEQQGFLAHADDLNNKSSIFIPLMRPLLWTAVASTFVFAVGCFWGLLPQRTAGGMINASHFPDEAVDLSSAPLLTPGKVFFRMRAGAKRDNEEWEVHAGFVHVRIQPSTSAKLYGLKQKGQILVGHQDVANWVKLKHETGWVAISSGARLFLHRRLVTYSQLVNGSCVDAGGFPITEGTACMSAAIAMGHPVEQLRSLEGVNQPEGCYMQSYKPGEVWIGASSRRRDGRSHRVVSSSLEQLCSSGSYATFSDSYMGQQEVAARMRQVAQSLSEGRSKCPPAGSCAVLWSLHFRDFVRKGFGATLASLFEPLRAYSAYSGCTWIVSEEFAMDWTSWKLGPFWTSTLPDNQWQARFTQASDCGLNENISYWGPPSPVKCEHTLLSPNGETAFRIGPSYNGPGPPTGVFKGIYDLMLQTLGPRLEALKTPFTEAYAAIHIRHGDKVVETKSLIGIDGAARTLKKYWPHMKNVFVTSDDAKVISDAKKVLGNEYVIKSTADEHRWIGGTPMSNNGDHVHDDGAVNAVLRDINGLARASVLIGAPTSNFFSTALTLNVNLHAKLLRRRPWCWDESRGRFCG